MFLREGSVTVCDLKEVKICFWYFVFSGELNESVEKGQQLTEENSALKTDLSEAQVNLAKKSDMVIDLQGNLKPFFSIVYTL